jgi:hypothetical protein
LWGSYRQKISTPVAAAQIANKGYVDDGDAAALEEAKAYAGGTSNYSLLGWAKFPSGLIIQWGYGLTSATTNTRLNFNFPIAFPNECLSCTGNGHASSVMRIAIGATSASQGYVFSEFASFGFNWIAIGF